MTIDAVKKTISFCQFASEVIKEGDESCTTKLCQQCYNKSLVARGDKPLTTWQWYEFVEKKGASWKVMENVGKISTHERRGNVLAAKDQE